jgi:hypothetical protein
MLEQRSSESTFEKSSDIGDTNCIRDIMVTGYTRATINMDNSSKIILYAHPCFQGNPYYNWAYVHFQEVSPDDIEVENLYLSCIIGFITLQGITAAVIQCAENHYFGWTLRHFFF